MLWKPMLRVLILCQIQFESFGHYCMSCGLWALFSVGMLLRAVYANGFLVVMLLQAVYTLNAGSLALIVIVTCIQTLFPITWHLKK